MERGLVLMRWRGGISVLFPRCLADICSMNNSHIDTIIWDLGGVLIDWNPDYVYRDIYPDPAERRWFFEHVCTHEWNLQQDAGRSLSVATEEKIAEWPEYAAQIRAYYGRWSEMLGGSVDASVEILRTLKEQQTHRLFALTNWSHETFPVARERYNFLGWFEGIVVSGEEGVVKPEREIFDILLKRYHVDPERAVFIDDNKTNVEGAKDVGIRGLHFTGSDRLLEELRKLDKRI